MNTAKELVYDRVLKFIGRKLYIRMDSMIGLK